MAQTSQNMETSHSQHVDKPMKTKPTTPAIKKSQGSPTRSRDVPIRMGATRVWNRVRPKKGVQGTGISRQSKIKNFAELTAVKQPDYSDKTAHFAPGVPNTAEIRNGYTAPGKGSGKMRGGSTDIGTANAYPAEAQTSYD